MHLIAKNFPLFYTSLSQPFLQLLPQRHPPVRFLHPTDQIELIAQRIIQNFGFLQIFNVDFVFTPEDLKMHISEHDFTGYDLKTVNAVI